MALEVVVILYCALPAPCIEIPDSAVIFAFARQPGGPCASLVYNRDQEPCSALSLLTACSWVNPLPRPIPLGHMTTYRRGSAQKLACI